MTKTWYIVFYAWDVGLQELVRKRVLKDDLAEISDRNKRITTAKEYADDITYLLKFDHHLESNPAPKLLRFTFDGYSLIDAITYVANYKKEIKGLRKNTIDEYIATRSTLQDFLLYAGLKQNFRLKEVNDTFVTRYFDYLKQVRKIKNKTFNDRRTMLHAAFEVLIKRDPHVCHGVNPIAKVEKLKVETNKHAAYSNDQMTLIREAILKGKEPHLILFIQHMFYTLARPEELRMLKVGHIMLEERRIRFTAEGKTGIEAYVGINDRFYEILKESRIIEFPQNYYVFSNDGGQHCPGPTPVGKNYFYKRIRRYIKALGFYKLNKNYTLYSFKHSGAISLYKATKDIKLLQSQCRHQNIEQTNIYLRNLGLFTDFEQLNKWVGPW